MNTFRKTYNLIVISLCAVVTFGVLFLCAAPAHADSTKPCMHNPHGCVIKPPKHHGGVTVLPTDPCQVTLNTITACPLALPVLPDLFTQ